MSASQKSLRVAFVAAVPLLLALVLVAGVALPTLAASGTTVTKLRTNGRGANVQLFDPASNSYGFITVSQDQQANTSSIIFNLGTLDALGPGIDVILFASGEIPNDAFRVDTKPNSLGLANPATARLLLTTPPSLIVFRCVYDINTNSGTCEPTATPVSFDLTWTTTGLQTTRQKVQSTETSGPISIKSDGEYVLLSALITGTWGGHITQGSPGTLSDTQGRQLMREATVKTN